MSLEDKANLPPEQGNELGMVICKVCHQLIHTLPTRGVKKIYSLCHQATCQEQARNHNVE